MYQQRPAATTQNATEGLKPGSRSSDILIRIMNRNPATDTQNTTEGSGHKINPRVNGPKANVNNLKQPEGQTANKTYEPPKKKHKTGKK